MVYGLGRYDQYHSKAICFVCTSFGIFIFKFISRCILVQWRHQGGHGGFPLFPRQRVCPLVSPESEGRKMTKISYFREFFAPSDTHFGPSWPPSRLIFWCRHCSCLVVFVRRTLVMYLFFFFLLFSFNMGGYGWI